MMAHEIMLRNGTSKADAGNRRVHRRTIAVVTCCVLLPWIVVAIPGTSHGGAGTTGMNISNRWHGWPFVHFLSTRVTVSGSWIDHRFIRGLMPPDLDLDQLAARHAASFNTDVGPLQLDLRLYRGVELVNSRQYGYWSELSRWPTFGPGHHYSIRSAGVVLNLLTVGFVGTFCEYRIRRYGRLIVFSRKSLGLALAVTGLVAAWGAWGYSLALAEANDLQLLSELDEQNHLTFYAEHETRFPLVLSQLLNHGNHPWGSFSWFHRLTNCGHLWVRHRQVS